MHSHIYQHLQTPTHLKEASHLCQSWGETLPTTKDKDGPLANDWQLHVNLGKQLKFPQHFIASSLWSDMIITPEGTKRLIMLELTVPWEEYFEEAKERKRTNLERCQDRGWKICLFSAGRSHCKVLNRFCLQGVEKMRDIQSASEGAEKSTRWLWTKKTDPWLVADGTQVGAR